MKSPEPPFRNRCFAIFLMMVVPALHASPPSEHVLADRIARIEQDLRTPLEGAASSESSKSLQARMAELRVPGVSVTVFDEGQIIWAKGYGQRNSATGEPVDSQTLFQAASISKPVSAVGMFRLFERGKVLLDADVNTMLRSWAIPQSSFSVVEKVTLRRIVSHMSGLSVSGFAGYAVDAPVPSVIQILNGAAPANSAPVRVESMPGSQETYSGGGYVVMQLLMQDVTGRPFDALMKDLVLKPVGMTRSSFGQPLPDRFIKEGNFATGYRSDGTPVPGRYHVYPEQAPAGLWTTPSDLARFMLAVGRSYRGEQRALLKVATAREIMTRVPGGSGLGFGISGTGPTERYRHSGGNEGFRGYAVAFTGSGRGMVVLVNSDQGSTLYAELLDAVSREYNWPRMNVRAP
jgi:CubicO group peptidase (beta-lactamase class C family)